MMSRFRYARTWLLAACLASPAAIGAWPNGPTEDPQLAYPNDGSYVHLNSKGEVTGGQWNLWSFVPPGWASNKGFRQAEVAIGTGIHADRAWQRTIGDRSVMIAVLDSGINWDSGDLQMKFHLNKGELGGCKPLKGTAVDEWDIDGSGFFNIKDYLITDPTFGETKDAAGNKNGRLEPEDLILTCSDGVDDDKNGFTDDISGWDAYQNDNNPKDDTRYGHGTGEARDSGAAGNDGQGDIGVCPECEILMVRVGDSFIADVNDFATGVIFGVDSGASLIQEALGTLNNNEYSVAAIEYAYKNNVAIVASAADELSFHHNMPGTNNHTMYVHAIVHDSTDAKNATTFLNFNNCTNFGGQLILSTPGGGCSSEATGITSGHVGLIYSAGVKAKTSPPLSAEEIRGILIMSVDDIDVPEADTDKTKFPSRPGWDLYFGYGRNNARKSVDMVLDDKIPPEVDIADPLWFEPINVGTRKTVDVTGRVGARVDGEPARYDDYSWVLEYAQGVDPLGGWEEISNGKGIVGGAEPGKLATWDIEAASKKVDYTKPIADPHDWSFTLRLRVEARAGSLKSEYRKTIHILSDPTLLPGYPKNMFASVEGSGKVVDIDGDGVEEFIVVSTEGRVHALHEGGTEAPGFPAKLDERAENKNIGGICAFRDDKTGCKPVGKVDAGVNREWSMMGPAVGALTGDVADGLSIVVASYGGGVWVFDKAGELQEGWPQFGREEFASDVTPDRVIDTGFFGAPVLYDMDNDLDLEIIVAGMDGYLYVWHHDGSPLKGWPLLVHDPIEPGAARMIITPAVGDVDADGNADIVVCTNEVYGKNEGRGYVLKGTGGSDPSKTAEALVNDGWPLTLSGLIVETLPVVGTGCPSNPALANLDDGPELEIHMDAIALNPQLWTYDGVAFARDGLSIVTNNFDFGSKSNSGDTPSYTLINHGIFLDLDRNGTLDLAKGTAGFGFASTFAAGGLRAQFDHQLSVWSTGDGEYLKYWPRKVDDWQFFISPTAADIDGDGKIEIISGTAGYLLHAFRSDGTEPEGFPKNTGGWITSSAAFGDLDGDGNFDLVSSTRNGWIFAWAMKGPTSGTIQWQTFGHDLRNTNNYETKVAEYNDYPEPAADATDAVDAVDGEDGEDGAADSGDATDAADSADSADGTDAADSGDTTDASDDSTDATDGTTPVSTQPAEGCTAGAQSTGFGPLFFLALLGLGALVRRRFLGAGRVDDRVGKPEKLSSAYGAQDKGTSHWMQAGLCHDSLHLLPQVPREPKVDVSIKQHRLLELGAGVRVVRYPPPHANN